MPIEVRELVIKAQIGSGQQNGKVTAQEQTNPSSANEEELVKKCVEKVMEILKEKAER